MSHTMPPSSEAQLRQQYQAAVEALNRRQWPRARQLAEPLLGDLPAHGGLHFVVGMACLEMADLKGAFRHLLQASQFSPQRPDYAAQFARVLMEARMYAQALEEAGRAMALNPQDPMSLNVLAVVFTRGNAHDQAAEAFRRAVALVPREAGLHLNLATSLMATGDLAGAAAACERAVELNPRLWKAHLTLAQMARQTPEHNHVARLRSLLASAGDDAEGVLYLNMALEKELDDLGEPQSALAHLIEGKRTWRTRLDFSNEPDASVVASILKATTQAPVAGEGFDSAAPIFIFGMPRSGTTLVERILSSHSAVHSAGELQAFPMLMRKALPGASRLPLDSNLLAGLPGVDWAALGRDYIEATRPMAGQRAHFIDKLPQNFLYAGFIARALPNARLVCLRRDAMDTCIANFRQLFSMGAPTYNYSFDLLETGRYWLLFDQLVRHYQQVMPGRILEVHYEDVVNDQEGQTRRLLEHCGLPWEDACLQFEKNAAPVSTASAVQVRSKIYRSSLQRWKRYGPMVDELRALLAQGGASVGD